MNYKLGKGDNNDSDSGSGHRNIQKMMDRQSIKEIPSTILSKEEEQDESESSMITETHSALSELNKTNNTNEMMYKKDSVPKHLIIPEKNPSEKEEILSLFSKLS